MDAALENELVSKFPGLFQDLESNDKNLIAMFGCECSDGWYQLIYQACRTINSHQKHVASSTYDQDHKDNVAAFRWSQIKEKFGTLRLYYYGGDEFISGVIALAEQLSAVTCEVCGNPGELTGRGWVRTLCPACHTSGN